MAKKKKGKKKRKQRKFVYEFDVRIERLDGTRFEFRMYRNTMIDDVTLMKFVASRKGARTYAVTATRISLYESYTATHRPKTVLELYYVYD